DLDAVLVCFVDRGAELVAGDRGVRLEPRYTLLRPGAHDASGLVWLSDRMHPHGTVRRALEVWPGDDDLRTDRLPARDLRLDVHLLIRVDAAGRANGRHAIREKELGVAHRHELHRPAHGRRVIHVVVQAHDPWNDRAV